MNKYQVKHISAAEHDQHCENCGKAISYVALLIDSQGHTLKTGLDCAETLTSKFNASRAMRNLKTKLSEPKYTYKFFYQGKEITRELYYRYMSNGLFGLKREETQI